MWFTTIFQKICKYLIFSHYKCEILYFNLDTNICLRILPGKIILTRLNDCKYTYEFFFNFFISDVDKIPKK